MDIFLTTIQKFTELNDFYSVLSFLREKEKEGEIVLYAGTYCFEMALERFGNYTYIQCKLETGRTHQIRVHMASIGHPLLGDQVYGPAKCPIKNLQGQTLHAKTLGIVHPRTEEYLEVNAPLPEYFISLLNTLSRF